MELQEAIERRRMMRSFDGRPLSAELVERILANARRGPSAGFSQGIEILVLEGRERTAAFWAATGPAPEAHARWPNLHRAPLIVVCLSHKAAYLDRYAEPDKGWTDRDESRWPVPYWHVDAGMAALLILLTAVDAGLGALFFGVADHDRFRRAFGVPADFTPVGAVAVGYAEPSGDRPSLSLRRKRRPAEQVVHRGAW